jgi:predicted DNA-binding transcriptional regulator YafY
VIAKPSRAPAWPTLEQALTERRPVRAVYRGSQRVVCPHALGWKNGRPKVLAYQVGGTSHGGLSTDPRQRWRCMFVDEIDDAMITDGPWKTADNYSHDSNCIDDLEIEVP